MARKCAESGIAELAVRLGPLLDGGPDDAKRLARVGKSGGDIELAAEACCGDQCVAGLVYVVGGGFD